MGLLGSMIAGGARKVADGRVADIEQREEFDLKSALLDAQYDKELRLKEAGFKMEDDRTQATMDKRKGYMTGDGDKELTTEEASAKAMKAGDFEAGEGLLKMVKKSEKTFDSVKLDDGSIMSFDKTTGEGKIVFEGGKEVKVPKDETEIIWRAANGDEDAQRAAKMLVEQKARVAAAGRAPSANKSNEAQSRRADFIEAYANNPKYVQGGKLTGEGYDKLNKLSDDADMQTVTREPVLDLAGRPKLDKQGNPLMTEKITRKEKVPEKPAPKGVTVKRKDGNYDYKRL